MPSSFPRRSPHPRLASSPSPYRKENPGKQAGGGMAGRPRRSYLGGQRRTRKQDENGERPHPVSSIIPRSHDGPTGLITYHINTIAPLTRQAQTRRRKRDAGTMERRRTRRRRENDERTRRKTEDNGNDARTTGERRNEKTHGPARRQASTRRTTTRRTRRDGKTGTRRRQQRQRQASKEDEDMRKREEQNAPISNLSPDPLPPSL